LSTLTPESLAALLVDAAEEKKAWDPVVIDLRGRTTVADYFVICDGETDRQLRAIADSMLERARASGIRPLSVDGYDGGTWILLDFDSTSSCPESAPTTTWRASGRPPQASGRAKAPAPPNDKLAFFS
jgi:ribosome-associated protein